VSLDDQHISTATLDGILYAIDVELTETNRQQVMAMIMALTVFEERNALRGDLWAQFDLEDAAHHLRSKSARMQHLGRGGLNPPEALDDAIDAINFAVFCVRHILGLKGTAG
jgi:hypothetical protein